MNENFYVYVFLDPRSPGFYVYDDLIFEYEPFYIGKGVNDRISISEYDKSNIYKFNKINKIKNEGLCVISYKIYENLTESESFNKERESIDKIGKIITEKGPLVNFSDGGNGGDNISKHPFIDDIKKKMSISKMGEKNSFFGKSHTDETKRILSEKNLGVNIGEKNSFFGKSHTDETKRIISENNKKNIGEKNHFYGKNHTLESKNKIREKALGRHRSEESKLKTSESLKKKNWGNRNNPFATKYIIKSPSGELLEYDGLSDLEIKLKGLNPRRILSQKEHRGYILISKIRINVCDKSDLSLNPEEENI